MAKLTNEDILNAVADMSVMDVVELVSAMEEKFGVSAAAAAAAPVAAADAFIIVFVVLLLKPLESLDQECHLDFLLVFQLVPTSMP
jgi:hypothetical protein